MSVATKLPNTIQEDKRRVSVPVAAGFQPAVEPGFQPGGTNGPHAINRIEGTGASASPALVRQPGWLPLQAFVRVAPQPLLISCVEPGFQSGEKNASNSATRTELAHISPCYGQIPVGKMSPSKAGSDACHYNRLWT